jgi:hypothetical protein
VDQNQIFSAPEVHGTNEGILNFGVSGYGSDQEYLLYQLMGNRFNADEVVVAFTPYNDVANNLAAKEYGYLKPYFTLENGQPVLHNDHIRNSGFRQLLSALDHHSRVWNLMGEFIRGVADLRRTLLKRDIGDARYATYRPDDVTDRDRQGVELTVAIFKKFQEAATARKENFYVIFIPYMPNVEKHLPYNHPLVPLIVAGLTREGTYRKPYPAFLKAAIAGGHPFNKNDRHFSAEGHALFAKVLTDTEMARDAIDYYKQPH